MKHRVWSVATTLAAILTAFAWADRLVTTAPVHALVGVWALNAEHSEAHQGPLEGAERGRGPGGPGGPGGGRGGGLGRGGMGGGRGPGGRGSREDGQRLRTAMREILDAPTRMTIVEADTMVIVTGADGRTLRLSTDGKKVRDESTGIERKTRWDGEKLVSEITGAGPGKMVETYEVDAETGRLRRTVQADRDRGTRPPRYHVYDRES